MSKVSLQSATESEIRTLTKPGLNLYLYGGFTPGAADSKVHVTVVGEVDTTKPPYSEAGDMSANLCIKVSSPKYEDLVFSIVNVKGPLRMGPLMNFTPSATPVMVVQEFEIVDHAPDRKRSSEQGGGAKRGLRGWFASLWKR